jgi:4'-phosphopantetheinyl transferase
VRPRSEPDLVEVWQVRLEEHRFRLPALAALLSADERGRAGRFRSRADADAFVLRRGILREFVARYVGVPPADVSFTYGRWGKPFVDGDLRFNTSSSAGVALYAFSSGRAVGVDVERMRELPDMDEVAARIGVASLRAEPDRLDAFYAVWTQKEAYVKALGDGFAAPLESFDVPTRVSDGTSTVVEGRRIVVLPAPPGYAAAVAAEGTGWTVRYGSYAAATRLGTTIAHASRTSSFISASSIAASRTHTQL